MRWNTDHAPEFVVVSGSLDIGKPRSSTFDTLHDLFGGRYAYDWVERTVGRFGKGGKHACGGCDPYRTEWVCQGG